MPFARAQIAVVIFLFFGAWFANASGLSPVSSVYSYSANGQAGKQRFQGTGILLQDGDRYFVLTASHVGQGEKTEILLRDGERAEIIGCLANNQQDVELIEVKKPSEKPLGTWDATRGAYLAFMDSLREWSDDPNAEGDVFFNYNSKNPNLLNIGSISNRKFLLSPQWVKAKSAHGLDPLYSLDKEFITRSKHELFSSMSIANGMSGAPVVEMKPFNGGATQKYYYQIVGVAKRFYRNFDGSFFATEQEILKLREQYLSLTPNSAHSCGTVDSAKWELRVGMLGGEKKFLLYRSHSDGTKEISFATSPAGNATGADGGDAKNNTMSSLEAWRAFHLAPGLNWKGKPILGMQYVSEGRMSNIYADYSNLELLKSIEKRGGKILLAEENFVHLLLQRNGLPIETTAVAQKSSYTGFTKNYAYIGFYKPDDGVYVGQDAIRVKIPIYRDGGEMARIEFSINSDGSLEYNKQKHSFVPVFQIKDEKSGRKFDIDITELFFDNTYEPLAIQNRLERRYGLNNIVIRDLKTKGEVSLRFKLKPIATNEIPLVDRKDPLMEDCGLSVKIDDSVKAVLDLGERISF